jgi:hypothetical protein
MPFDIPADNAGRRENLGAAASTNEAVIVNDAFRRLDQERRASQDQIKLFKQSLILRWHSVALGYFSKERLHLSRWGIGDQHFTSMIPDKCPCMRQVSWREDGTSRSKRHTIITNFKEELSLCYIEPFILIWMNMTRRAALLAGSVLDDEQLTICVSSQNLKGDRCNSEAVSFIETVLARQYRMNWRGAGSPK